MLVAAYLRASGTGCSTHSRAFDPATDIGAGGSCGVVRGVGCHGIAFIDIQLHLLAALTF
ncbi:hypothetical protein D3C80_2232250 [compost metagenome]